METPLRGQESFAARRIPLPESTKLWSMQRRKQRIPDARTKRIFRAEVKRRARNRRKPAEWQVVRTGGRVFLCCKGKRMVEHAAVSVPRQVEICMVCEAHKCIARALRLVADANSIPQEGVCDRHRKRPRETFLPFRRNAGKRNAARHGSVIPHAFVKAMHAAMELVFALVRVEAVFLPVERKRRAADTVCISSD